MGIPTIMWTDTDVSRNPQGTTRIAFNANIDVKKGTLTQEEAFELMDAVDSNLEPIGFISLPNQTCLILSKLKVESNYKNEIGVLDIENGFYQVILRDNSDIAVDFNFSKVNLIKGVSKQNNNGNIIAYWVDGLNFDKYLNINNPIVERTSDFRIATIDDLTLMTQFRVSSSINVQFEQLSEGGSLKSAVYYVGVQQVDRDGNSTQVTQLSNPISVTDSKGRNFNNNYDGCVAGTRTSTGITITVDSSQLNNKFPYFRIVVVKKENQSLSAYLLPQQLLNGDINYTIYSLDNATDISVDALINDSNYVTSKTITQLDDVLYKAHLSSADEFELQPYVNNIKVNYITDTKDILGTNDNYRNPLVIFEDKSFMWDETYALYVSLEIESPQGTIETKAYHLPGRPVANITINGTTLPENTKFDDINTVITNFFDKNDNSGDKYYWEGNQMYRTSNKAKLFHTVNTADNSNAISLYDSNMGYWENENEVYSNEDKWLVKDVNDTVIGDLRGQKVRHHKFPESTITNGLYIDDDKTTAKAARANVLGIQLTNVQFPAEVNVKNIKIYYAKRDFNNRTILGQSLGLNCWGYGRNNGTGNFFTGNVFSSIGNVNFYLLEIGYAFANLAPLGINPGPPPSTLPLVTNYYFSGAANNNSLPPSPFDAVRADSGYIKCKPFDIVSQDVSIVGATHVKNVYRIKGTYFQSDPDKLTGIALADNLDIKLNFDTSITFQGVDNSSVPSLPSNINKIRRIKNAELLNNNVGDSKGPVWSDPYSYSQLINNPQGDKAVWIEMDGMLQAYTDLTPSAAHRDAAKVDLFSLLTYENSLNNSENNQAAPYLTNICSFKEDLFFNFENLNLCYTGKTLIYSPIPTINYDIFGGDTFTSYYGERSTLTLEDGMVGNPVGPGQRNQAMFRAVHYYICQSTSNINYRHEGDNPTEKYYPKSSRTEVVTLPNFVDNWYGYNVDYSSVNDIIQPLIEPNGKSITQTEFTNRIIRSATNNPELSSDNYRIWEAGNEIDVGLDKGPIWDINGFQNKLFIQTERSIFQTLGRQILKTENSESFVGAGDIFEAKPQELVSTSGIYGGTQSRFTTKTSQYGLMFADTESGIVFNVGDKGLDEISKNGQEIFFRDNLKFELPNYIDRLTYENTAEWSGPSVIGDVRRYNGTIYKCLVNTNDNPSTSNWEEIEWKFRNKESILDKQSVGVETVFDYKYRRFILTKKDYDTINNSFIQTYGGVLNLNSFVELNIYQYEGRFYSVFTSVSPEFYDIDFGNNIYGIEISLDDYFEPKSFTIAYYPEFKGWVSFYSYFPQRFFSNQKGVLSYNENLFKQNSPNGFLYYYNSFEPFLLDFPLVYGEPNRLSSVLAKTIVTDRLTLLRKYNKTFDTHLVYDSFQCSTPVNLINTKTQRNSEGYWIMNNFRDYVLDYSFPFLQRSLTYFNLLIPNSNVSISKHWSKLKKFVDYWFINRFTYNNNWERVYVSNNSSLDLDPITLIYYLSDDAFDVHTALRENELLRLDDFTIIKTKSILTNGSRMSYYLVSGPQPVDGQQYSKVERINNDLLEVHDIQGLTFKNYR
jgi:hypothetical protein